MNKMKLIEAILGMDCKETKIPESSSESFMVLEKVYAIRTITMIYTGRLKAVNDKELLLDEVAWIPDTERWADFVDTGAHKEAEPYKRPVVLSRGAILDCTEIPSVIRKQK